MTLPTFHRRHLGVLLLASAAAWGAHAQERFPAKPITIVVPQAAGGANDAIARVLGQKLSQQLGQSVVIDNRPGAGSCIFLHVWQDAAMPTAGCTAASLANMSEVCAWLDATANPLLVQLPQAEYIRYRQAWALP